MALTVMRWTQWRRGWHLGTGGHTA